MMIVMMVMMVLDVWSTTTYQRQTAEVQVSSSSKLTLFHHSIV